MIQENRFFKLDSDGSYPNNLGIDDKIVTDEGTKVVKDVKIIKYRDRNGVL